MTPADKSASIVIGIMFLLFGLLVHWPDTYTWYQEWDIRGFMFVISAGAFGYLAFGKR